MLSRMKLHILCQTRFGQFCKRLCVSVSVR